MYKKKETKLWDIQKSIGEEEKLALKKEELEKEIRKNKFQFSNERNNSNSIVESLDFFSPFYCYQYLSTNFR